MTSCDLEKPIQLHTSKINVSVPTFPKSQHGAAAADDERCAAGFLTADDLTMGCEIPFASWDTLRLLHLFACQIDLFPAPCGFATEGMPSTRMMRRNRQSKSGFVIALPTSRGMFDAYNGCSESKHPNKTTGPGSHAPCLQDHSLWC